MENKKIEFRQFDRDFNSLSELINSSWQREHDIYLDYTPDYLSFLNNAPDVMPDMTLGAYLNGELISYVFSKIKNIVIENKTYKTVLYSLASTNENFIKYFPYLKLRDICMKKSREMDFDISYGFAANGISNNEIERFICKKFKNIFFLVNNFSNYIYDLNKIQNILTLPENVRFEIINHENCEECVALINENISKLPIYEVLDKNLYMYKYDSDYYYSRAIYCDDILSGIISGLIIEMRVNNSKRKIVIIYDLFLENIDSDLQISIFTKIVNELKLLGVEKASVPDTGCFSKETAHNLGLKKNPFNKRETNFSMTVIKDSLTLNLQNNNPFYTEII